MRRRRTPALLVLAVALTAGCHEAALPVDELRRIPITDLEGVVTMPGEGVVLDPENSWDGNGALRMVAAGPSQVRLYDVGDIDIEEAVLIYRARLRTRNVEGQVYLEMYLTFPELGTYFSRSDAAALSGTVDWVDHETRFLLKKGENPSRVQLNVVIDGEGEVWVDDIRLLRSPAPG